MDAIENILAKTKYNAINSFICNIVHWVVSLVEEKVFLRLELKKEVL